MIHLGYLAYDEDEEMCYIPNREIHKEWQNAVSDNADYAETNKIIADSKNLLREKLAGNEEAVARALDISHIHVTSNRSYNNEESLQSAIYLAYIYALNGYIIEKEATAGMRETKFLGKVACDRRFADIIYIPFDKTKPAMIVELKHNKSANSALNQIKEKQYADCLSNWHGDLLFVGINYDEKSKRHECKIEELVK